MKLRQGDQEGVWNARPVTPLNKIVSHALCVPLAATVDTPVHLDGNARFGRQAIGTQTSYRPPPHSAKRHPIHNFAIMWAIFQPFDLCLLCHSDLPSESPWQGAHMRHFGFNEALA